MDLSLGFGRLDMKVKYVKDCKKECIKLLNEITDDWILKRIYLFALGMTKED